MVVPFNKFQNLPVIVKKEQEYHQCFPFLEAAVQHLLTILDNANRDYKANNKTDLFISREVRAKSWKSVQQKLWEELKNTPATRIEAKDVRRTYNNIHDLTGGRIEVNYFDEVQDRAGHLMRYFSSRKFDTDLKKLGIDDKVYLEDDKEGYRAYHLFMSCPVKRDKGNPKKVIFEIQIRSSFQHVWAKLMHPLVYSRFRGTEKGIPEEIITGMVTLSMQIHAADNALMALRNQTEQKWKEANG